MANPVILTVPDYTNTALNASPTAHSIADILRTDLEPRLPASGTLVTTDDITPVDISVPAADSTDNVAVTDVVGNKTDAAVTAVGTTKSAMAYLKGLLGLVLPSKTSATTTGVIVEDDTSGTPNVVNVATHSSKNTLGSWVQMDASASADSWISNVRVATPIDAYGPWVIEIGTGSAGAEATKIRFSFVSDFLGSSGYNKSLVFPLVIPIKVASGTRIAARAAGSGSKTLEVSLSMYQSLE